MLLWGDLIYQRSLSCFILDPFCFILNPSYFTLYFCCFTFRLCCFIFDYNDFLNDLRIVRVVFSSWWFSGHPICCSRNTFLPNWIHICCFKLWFQLPLFWLSTCVTLGNGLLFGWAKLGKNYCGWYLWAVELVDFVEGLVDQRVFQLRGSVMGELKIRLTSLEQVFLCQLGEEYSVPLFKSLLDDLVDHSFHLLLQFTELKTIGLLLLLKDELTVSISCPLLLPKLAFLIIIIISLDWISLSHYQYRNPKQKIIL